MAKISCYKIILSDDAIGNLIDFLIHRKIIRTGNSIETRKPERIQIEDATSCVILVYNVVLFRGNV